VTKEKCLSLNPLIQDRGKVVVYRCHKLPNAMIAAIVIMKKFRWVPTMDATFFLSFTSAQPFTSAPMEVAANCNFHILVALTAARAETVISTTVSWRRKCFSKRTP
jgi:hypothetical protein